MPKYRVRFDLEGSFDVEIEAPSDRDAAGGAWEWARANHDFFGEIVAVDVSELPDVPGDGTRLIFPRRAYGLPGPAGSDSVEVVDHSDFISRYSPGTTFVVWAGAPGAGRVVHMIDRIDEAGIWGHVVEDTVRELDPGEVR